jgi:hypothetical protein
VKLLFIICKWDVGLVFYINANIGNAFIMIFIYLFIYKLI